MSLTRIYDDECRINDRVAQSAEFSKYNIDVPGNGDGQGSGTLAYMRDPHIIPQKWAGNRWTNMVDLQSQLSGLNSPLNRDVPDPRGINIKHLAKSDPMAYTSSNQLTTEESRSTAPAWMYRSIPNARTESTFLFHNPQTMAINNMFAHNQLSRDINRENVVITRR